MVKFSTRIERFGKLGEKTGWTYVEISSAQAEKLNPGKKVGYRVKGTLDSFPIQRVAILPMGGGKFIMPINAKLRKGIGKGLGDRLTLSLEVDERTIPASADFMKCLKDDARAMTHFKTLPGGHQRYFSKWIEEAKTITTKTRRITMAVIALGSGQGFPEMLRGYRNRKA